MCLIGFTGQAFGILKLRVRTEKNLIFCFVLVYWGGGVGALSIKNGRKAVMGLAIPWRLKQSRKFGKTLLLRIFNTAIQIAIKIKYWSYYSKFWVFTQFLSCPRRYIRRGLGGFCFVLFIGFKQTHNLTIKAGMYFLKKYLPKPLHD